jgi:hypothetical protein
MRTRFKLKQTTFFWGKFEKTIREPMENQFYFSAFAESWNSIVEAMLFDMARYHEIGDELDRIPPGKRWLEDVERVFSKKDQSRKFFDWWVVKFGERNSKPTHSMRNRDQHTGYDAKVGEPVFSPEPPEWKSDPLKFSLHDFVVYQKSSKKYEEAVDNYVSLPRIAYIRDQCPKDLAWIKEVVAEAEREFKIDLS